MNYSALFTQALANRSLKATAAISVPLPSEVIGCHALCLCHSWLHQHGHMIPNKVKGPKSLPNGGWADPVRFSASGILTVKPGSVRRLAEEAQVGQMHRERQWVSRELWVSHGDESVKLWEKNSGEKMGRGLPGNSRKREEWRRIKMKIQKALLLRYNKIP